MQAAQVRADEMAANTVYSHTRPDGRNFNTVTDCPYMAPEPNRGKRNNSAYIRYVAEKIAELKGITYEEVVEQTEKNARDMYRL